MTKIKICGLTRSRDIACVNEYKPDYVGFVFFEKSSRYVSPDQAVQLKLQLDSSIPVAGVFLDNDISMVRQLADAHVIDLIQLHGETMGETFIKELRAVTDLPVIRAFCIREPEDIRRAAQSSADYILLDSGAGGTGQTFDWSLIQELGRPYFLAGGLTPENVAEAVQQLYPYAVDVSSGVETEGVKDAEKIRSFLEAVRQADGCNGRRR